jgi:BTB/POZ domain
MELNPAFATDGIRLGGDEVGDETHNTIKTGPTTIIDSSGDVILKLGKSSLKVSSKVLSVASPVFRAMFGPHFQEGESLSKRYEQKFERALSEIWNTSD